MAGLLRTGEKPTATYVLMGICILIPPLSMTWIPGLSWLLSKLVFVPALTMISPHRVLTGAFVHASYIHLAFNMLALYIVGPHLEAALGRARYVALYLLSALGGSLGVLLWTSTVDPAGAFGGTVGASGAIFGLFAAAFIGQRAVGLDARGLGILIAINLGSGFVLSGISWQAHLGGLLLGGLTCAGYHWAAARERRIRAGAFERAGAAAAQQSGLRWRTASSIAIVVGVLVLEILIAVAAVEMSPLARLVG